MADVALFELNAEHEGCEAVDVQGVTADEVRGHIAVAPVGSFVDLGNGTLHLWAFQSGHLGVVQARALGEALTAWADRQEADRG